MQQETLDPSKYTKWEVEEVCGYLKLHGDVQAKFKEQEITGVKVKTLTDTHLRYLGIKPHDERLRIRRSSCSVKGSFSSPLLLKSHNERQRILTLISELPELHKVVNDPVHGHIELHPLLVKIIDTPQFQRLRFLKQLGAANFVYPGATHTRFDHSIGVAHLAGQLVETLRKNQPELNISEEDVLCVKIAGLCHDLGHGPFSHLFDGFFISKNRDDWKHEDGSLKLFDHMVKENNLEPEMKDYGLKLPEDLNFIKEMIHSKPAKRQTRKDKPFLFEIVANKTNGIDVDKFDYFARDCHYLGIQNNFDHRRFIMFARVCEVKEEKGEKHICIRDKELHNMCNMFYTRSSLHRRAYQHKVVNNIQIMIADAFLKADNKSPSSGGDKITLSGAIGDMKAYTKLTDKVFEDILYSSSEEMMAAREILERIIKRDLYRCLGDRKNEKPSEKRIEEWIKKELAKDGLSKDDFEVSFITIDYGMKDNNPMDKVYFYTKTKPNKATTTNQELSMLLPETICEKTIAVYFKKSDEESLAKAKESFETWKKVPFPSVEQTKNMT